MRFGKWDSEKRDLENGIRKNGIRKRKKRDLENGIRKMGLGKTGFGIDKNWIRKTRFGKLDSKNGIRKIHVVRAPSRSAFKPIGLGPAKMGSSLSLLCNCNSRASSPSTGSIAIHVVSIFMCTT